MIHHKFMGIGPVLGGLRGYMAPEFVPTFASDIYSVGKVMLRFIEKWNLQPTDSLSNLLGMMVETKQMPI